MDMHGAYALASDLAQKIKTMPNVSGVYIPQNLDFPGIALNIDREKASLIGLSARDVVDNVITAMTSDGSATVGAPGRDRKAPGKDSRRGFQAAALAKAADSRK